MRTKYAFDSKRKLYYINFETGLRTASGKKEYKKITAQTVAKLDEKVKAAKEQAELNIINNNMTLDEWFQIWFSTYKVGCKESTQIFYRRKYEAYISPKIGNKRIADITELHCQRILSELGENHAEKTVKEVRGILSSLFDKAVKNRLISQNIAADLVVHGLPKKERRALTNDERCQFLAACSRHPFGEFGAFVYFFGLRRGEALGLCGNDIDLQRNCLTVQRQITHPDSTHPKVETLKTAAGYRTIPIPSKAYDFIDFAALPEGFIFDENGSHLTMKMFTLRWKSLIDFAFPNGTDITPHTLRHNYCTMLFEAGLSPVEAHRIIGHSNISTTYAIYTHYSEQIENQATHKVLQIG